MQLELERSLLMKAVRKIDDVAFIKKVKTYVQAKVDIEEYNREIDEAMKEMDAGYLVTHEDAVKRVGKWRKKSGRHGIKKRS